MRMCVEAEEKVSFEIGYDETHYSAVGNTVEATPGRWVGVKAGLFAIHEGEGERGSVAVDYFVFEEQNDGKVLSD